MLLVIPSEPSTCFSLSLAFFLVLSYHFLSSQVLLTLDEKQEENAPFKCLFGRSRAGLPGRLLGASFFGLQCRARTVTPFFVFLPCLSFPNYFFDSVLIRVLLSMAVDASPRPRPCDICDPNTLVFKLTLCHAKLEVQPWLMRWNFRGISTSNIIRCIKRRQRVAVPAARGRRSHSGLVCLGARAE
jgi:hypothetical protein